MSYERTPSAIRLVPMCAVLTLLLLFAAEVTGWFALLFLFPIALAMLPLCEERLWGYLIVCDLLIALFVLALPVPHYVWLAFICVLAPYVPLRHAMRGCKDPRLSILLPIGIDVLWTTAVLFLLMLLGVNVFTAFPVLLTVLVGFSVLLFLFLLDVCYQLLLPVYRSRLRRLLLPRA